MHPSTATSCCTCPSTSLWSFSVCTPLQKPPFSAFLSYCMACYTVPSQFYFAIHIPIQKNLQEEGWKRFCILFKEIRPCSFPIHVSLGLVCSFTKWSVLMVMRMRDPCRSIQFLPLSRKFQYRRQRYTGMHMMVVILSSQIHCTK